MFLSFYLLIFQPIRNWILPYDSDPFSEKYEYFPKVWAKTKPASLVVVLSLMALYTVGEGFILMDVVNNPEEAHWAYQLYLFPESATLFLLIITVMAGLMLGLIITIGFPIIKVIDLINKLDRKYKK